MQGVTNDASEPPATLGEALAVRRNGIIGLGVGIVVAVSAYSVRVFELLGPAASVRQFPVFGPETWFILLAIVFAIATALGVVLVLTAIRFYKLSQSVTTAEE